MAAKDLDRDLLVNILARTGRLPTELAPVCYRWAGVIGTCIDSHQLLLHPQVLVAGAVSPWSAERPSSLLFCGATGVQQVSGMDCFVLAVFLTARVCELRCNSCRCRPVRCAVPRSLLSWLCSCGRRPLSVPGWKLSVRSLH